jgi:hypothetical protein
MEKNSFCSFAKLETNRWNSQLLTLFTTTTCHLLMLNKKSQHKNKIQNYNRLSQTFSQQEDLIVLFVFFIKYREQRLR